jgi:hypothetical protein
MLGRFIAICATALFAIVLLSAIAHADDYFSPTAYEPPQCVDPNSDVVGYRACPQYGSWGENLLAPYVFVEIGANLWHFSGPGTSGPAATPRSTTSTSTSTSTAAMTNNIESHSRMLTYDERVGVGIPLGFYIAFDFELGAYSDGTSPSSSGLIALASPGWHHRFFGRLTLAAELSGGVRAFSPNNAANLTTDGMFLARGRAQVWITPWFTIGGSAGVSLLRDGGWVTGVELGFHTRAYGRH